MDEETDMTKPLELKNLDQRSHLENNREQFSRQVKWTCGGLMFKKKGEIIKTNKKTFTS